MHHCKVGVFHETFTWKEQHAYFTVGACTLSHSPTSVRMDLSRIQRLNLIFFLSREKLLLYQYKTYEVCKDSILEPGVPSAHCHNYGIYSILVKLLEPFTLLIPNRITDWACAKEFGFQFLFCTIISGPCYYWIVG